MKKIVLIDEIQTLLANEKGFLGRGDIEVLLARSNDDVLRIHRVQKADIIITSLHASGMKSEDLCSAIRADEALSKVSIIILCPNNAADIKRSAQCKSTMVVTQPVAPAQLLAKVQQLMDLSLRESHRVDVTVPINIAVLVSGARLDRPFFGRSKNVSATGILIELEAVLEKGDQVLCSFFLPGSPEGIKTNGEIVRIVKQGKGSDSIEYGIRFFALTDKEKSIVESFIERQSPSGTSKK